MQGCPPPTQGELFHLPGLEELMVLTTAPASGEVQYVSPCSTGAGNSEGLCGMQRFTGAVPQAEPLICSTGRAQTRGCVYFKNPIPKLSVPNWELCPP